MFSAAATGAKAGLENAAEGMSKLKDSLLENETARQALQRMQGELGKLETALKKGDRALSIKTLALYEKAIEELKKKL
jgi:hypothetical protein